MKKIILGSLLAVSSVMSDVVTLLPYMVNINYDNDINKSAKKDGVINGIYTSVGDLNYLIEFNYSLTDIKYKDITIRDLKQDDFTVTYAKYYRYYMLKGGIHHINTTDIDLGDANILIGAVGGYHWKGYDKYSYGLEGYYSNYKNGYDENDILKSINVIQVTPYYIFSKAININTRNIIKFKVNHVIAPDYTIKNYTSYEIEDTLYYQKFFTTIKAYGGEMKTGVKDNGNTIYNTKDLLKDGYSIKLGYNIHSNLSVSASYAINNFEENGQTGETSNNSMVTTLTYNF
jgi:hypothetical protein